MSRTKIFCPYLRGTVICKHKKCDNHCSHFEKWVKERSTCKDCKSSNSCEWAFDAYNSDGDCLAAK